MRSRYQCCRGKAIIITYSQCMFVALSIQHATHKRYDFPEKLWNTKFVFWFFLQLLSETFLILRRVERDIINVHRFSCKEPVISSHILMKLQFSENFSTIKFYKYPSSGSRVVPWGRTDRNDIANSRFSQILRTRLRTSLLMLYRAINGTLIHSVGKM